MKKFGKHIFLLLSCMLFWQAAQAQGYRTVGGIRMGEGLGFSFKQKIWEQTTMEAILLTSVGNQETGLVGLVERHHPILFKRLNFFTGIGMHKTWESPVPDTDAEFSDPAGISGIIGAELTIGRFNVSWDYMPQLNVWGDAHFYASNTAVSLRYVFLKKKKKKANLKFWEWGKKKKRKKKDRNWKFWQTP